MTSSSPSPVHRPSRALAIVHHDGDMAAMLGVIGEWVARRAEVEVRYVGDPLPDPAGYDLVLCYGSAASAHDDSVPWLAAELTFLRDAAERASVLGICFGAQALARALGGSVRPATAPEIGWYEVAPAGPAPAGPGPAGPAIKAGPWFEFHYDTFTVPPGAVELARTTVGPQAFTWGRSLAIQFHAEITPDVFAAWEALQRPGALRDGLARQGIDPDAFTAAIAAHAPASRSRAEALVAGFWSTHVAPPTLA